MINFIFTIIIPLLLVWACWKIWEEVSSLHDELLTKTGYIGRKFETLTEQLDQIQKKLDKLSGPIEPENNDNGSENHD